MAMQSGITSLLETLLLIALVAAVADAQPEYGGFYTAERIANLRANVRKYDWAKRQRLDAVAAAEPWVRLSDEELWRMIPCQKLPRTIDPQMHNGKRTGGCPLCGSDVYRHSKYPWKVDIPAHPWKVICPDCGEALPKNDFGKYYLSGIDETGCFNPEKADKSLLLNAEHPDPDDPMHKFAVDDGWGFQTPDGAVNRFIGYYGYRLWGHIKGGAAVLANAYLYTGEAVYAHKCGIILDRISDVYPEMDWAEYGGQGWFHSGSTDGGKIEGSIWETGTVITLARAFGMVKSGLYDQPALHSFLAEKGQQYRLPTPKGSYEQLVGNIETNLLGEFVKAIKTGRKIYGNEGGPQDCVVRCAVTLNREPLTGEWLDWVFKEGTIGQGALKPGEGGHVPGLVVGTIDRDGAGAEGAPGYSLSWGMALGAAADLLRDYGKYTRNDIYRDLPQFKQTFTAGWRLAVLGSYTPNIGDSGGCGSRGGIIAGDPNSIVRGYKYFKDPEIGIIAVWANRGKTEGLGRDIFAEDPLWIEKDLEKLVRQYGREPPIEGRNNAGYGLVSVEFGPRDSGHALWMYYGLNGVAGHKCELMMGYDAHGFTVCPPTGYRELWGAWPKSVEFEDNTISHNTVVVNDMAQSTIRVGQPEFFVQFGDFGGFSVDSREVYPGVAETYRRTMAMMKVGAADSYALDVFRIKGGTSHLYSFHALPGPVTTSGLRLTKQEGGSYAGADVPLGTSITGPRMGYSWLDNVERDESPPDAFLLDFKGSEPYWELTAADDLHVRYHGFTSYSDIALANGYPPGNQAQGQPEKLRYLLARRVGEEGLGSTCVALIEPFKGQALVKRAARLKVEGEEDGLEAVALKVELADGAIDYLMSGPDDDTLCSAEEDLSFRGRLLALRVREGQVEKAWIARGSWISFGDFKMKLPDAAYRGTVVKMDKDMQGRGYLWVDSALPTDDSLEGSEMIIGNDRKLNACYTIHGIEKQGELYRIDCGEVCFVRGFQDLKDYSKGYVHNFEEGAEWIIPRKASYKRI